MTKKERVVVKMLQELADGLRKHENYRVKALFALTLHAEWDKKERKANPNVVDVGGGIAYRNDISDTLEQIIYILRKPPVARAKSKTLERLGLDRAYTVQQVRVQPKTKSKKQLFWKADWRTGK